MDETILPSANSLANYAIRDIARAGNLRSRVIDSPRVGSEARSGVAVYRNRANGEFFWGELGRWAGSGEDAAEEAQLNEGLATLDYNVEDDLAQPSHGRFATSLSVLEQF